MDWAYQRFEFAARNKCENMCMDTREMRASVRRLFWGMSLRTQRMADVCEDRVADPLMQSAPSMAHLILAVAMGVAAKRGFGDLTIGRPQLSAWMRSMSKLSSMQRTVPSAVQIDP